MTNLLFTPPRLKTLQPPTLPNQWYAITLLTPFSGDYPVVAEIWYDWSSQTMLLYCYTLGGLAVDILVIQDQFFLGAPTDPYSPPQQWYGPFDSAGNWQVPSPNWLADKGLVFQGIHDVLETPAAWWGGLVPCTNGCEDPQDCPSQVGNWLWFRTDNQYPWRIMHVDHSNPYKLPLIGQFALVHFPTFQPSLPGMMQATVQMCRATASQANIPPDLESAARDRDIRKLLQSGQALQPQQLQAKLQELIPGLSPLSGDCSPFNLPQWANTLYLPALTVPTAQLVVLPTEIYYDWPIQRQLTKLYNPDSSTSNLVLTANDTYDIERNPNGSLKSCQKSDPVGLPYPNWPTQDQCQCRAVIVNNPNLSPNRTTMLITCPSDRGRVFWIWYTPQSQPIMFMECPQPCDVGLVLIDYTGFYPNVPIDPSIFDIPCYEGEAAAPSEELSEEF